MCRRFRIWGLLLLSAGIGFTVSAMIGGWLTRFIIGTALAAAGLLLIANSG